MKTQLYLGKLLLCTILALPTLYIQAQDPMGHPQKPENVVYQYRDTVQSVTDRAMNGPQFMIYPDASMSVSEAEALVNKLGLKEIADTNSGSVGVFKPVGKTYDNVKDFEAYKKFIDANRVISNLKIIGLGRGATFVNEMIAPNANEVAGIFTYGGKPRFGKVTGSVVPAYVALDNQTLAKQYIKANAATEVNRDKIHIIYANTDEPLQRVVLALDKKATPAEALADAWKTLLSKNYRYNNFRHTFYMGAKFGQFGSYELEPYTDMEAIGIKRLAVKKSLNGPASPGNKSYFWYEYMPKQCEKAAPASVPLVIMLHGHQNDNRTQSETSGFVEIAAKEGIILAEIEWQGLTRDNASDAALGLGGIEMVVMDIIHRYPQIDPSRIYSQGLSAGAMNSAALGIDKSYLFAAVASHSGGIFDMPVYGFSYETLMHNAVQKRGVAETAYFLALGTDDDTIPFPTAEKPGPNPYYNAMNFYLTLNDMPLLQVDYKAEPVLGVKMENRETIHTNKHITLEKGNLCKKGIPMVEFTAIMHYGHWNFRPVAERMWNFFRHYSRDVKTGKLIYHP